jgi:hypothetical protein
MQCGNNPRSASPDLVRRIAEYVAGFVDAEADRKGDVESRRPRE